MAAAFGIHVGNTSACLALYKDGKIEVIANDSGNRVTPAVVAFNETETIVGLAAKSGIARNGSVTVIHNKKLLNEHIDDAELEEVMKSSACKVKNEGGIKYEVKRGEKLCYFTPEDVATHIFTKMFDIANSALRSEDELHAVLTVPLHFQQSSRQTLMRSAEEAGFEVLQVISEPSATVLAYGVGSNIEEEHHCLVYRLGGETLDVTVVLVNAGMYTVLGTIHKSNLGGNRFTRILADYLAGEFQHRWKLDPQESRRSMVKLRNASEACKHVLSTMSTAHCFVESLCEGVDFSHNITRARFENLITPYLPEYVQPVLDVIKEANLSNKIITKLILSGGAMKTPKLQQAIGDLFPDAEVLNGISPDEVIATGAAKQGGYLPGPFDQDCENLSVEVPAVSKPICFKVSDELKCIIPALTPLPVRRSKTHSISSEQLDVAVEFYEVDRDSSCEAPRLLGKVDLSEIKTPTEISIELSMNSVGEMHIVIKDQKAQKRKPWKLEI
ncbi:heat shock 70 kDa protein 14-like [Periplaneta americana]|uniref:heat shock 70 kDa protein 14-like n=1 Tax=Periplaneta americana TaxID=6978 RepID=UPI0037E7229E